MKNSHRVSIRQCGILSRRCVIPLLDMVNGCFYLMRGGGVQTGQSPVWWAPRGGGGGGGGGGGANRPVTCVMGSHHLECFPSGNKPIQVLETDIIESVMSSGTRGSISSRWLHIYRYVLWMFGCKYINHFDINAEDCLLEHSRWYI